VRALKVVAFDADGVRMDLYTAPCGCEYHGATVTPRCGAHRRLLDVLHAATVVHIQPTAHRLLVMMEDEARARLDDPNRDVIGGVAP